MRFLRLPVLLALPQSVPTTCRLSQKHPHLPQAGHVHIYHRVAHVSHSLRHWTPNCWLYKVSHLNLACQCSHQVSRTLIAARTRWCAPVDHTPHMYSSKKHCYIFPTRTVSIEADAYVHGFLDICAKGLYGAFLTRFRLCLEDIHNQQYYINGGAQCTELDTNCHHGAGGSGHKDNNGMSSASSQAGGKREAFAQRLEDVRVNIGSDMLPVQTRNVFVPALGGGNGNMDGDAYQLSQAEPGEALDMRALPHSQSPSMQHGHTGNGYVPSRPAPSVSGRQSVVAQSVRAGEQRRPPPSGDEVYMMLRNFNALVNGMLSGYEEPAAASEAHDS
eukprot:Opistho-2@24587